MKLFYRILSLVLILTIFVSCSAGAFAAESEEQTVEIQSDSTKAGTDTIVGDWLFTDTIVNRGTNGAAKIMKEYAAAGVTDVYLLCKGIAGKVAWASSVTGTVRSSSTRDYLQEVCDAAKTYGIRVHPWLMASRDTNYVNNIDSSSPFYHFRVGTTSSVNQYINLRDTGYRNYMTALVKELVANYDIAGIHLDTIRYGALYYDWGLNARTELINNYGITKAEYNAATKAMCVTGGYAYTTNSDGYYVYSSSGTTATGVNFANALAGSGSTDALNGAKKFAQLRKDTVTNFVKMVKDAAGAGKVISCAIMPEPCTSSYESALYGQSPADLGSVVDYVAVMSYSCEYNAASTWPVTLTTACTKVGCKAIAGIQCYPSEGSSDPDPTGLTIYNETSGIRKAMQSDSKILGYAFFRGSFLHLAGAKVVNSTTIDMTVTPGDDAGNATKYVFTLQNGLTCSAISNKSGWASGASFAISSDKKTITITNGGSTILSEGSTGSFRMTVSGTVSETTGIAMLRAYTGSGYSEYYGYCGSILQSHTHSYTATVTTAASCSATGVKTYTCSCGSSYTEAIAKTAHNYTASTDSSSGLTTYTCSVCKYSYTSTCGATHSCVETWMRENNTHYTVCYDCKAKATEQCVFEVLSVVNPTDTTAGSVTYICVGSNSLSYQISRDAFSGKGCGRTYKVTLAAGSGYTYVNNFNGTHTRTNTATEASISNLAHVYTDGVCPCGEVERSFINLQFKEYSVANKLGYWTLNQLRGDIDNADGVMSGVAYGKDPHMQLLATGDYVNYKIQTSDIVEVRIKSTVLSGTATNMQFFYATTAEQKYTEGKSVTVAFNPATSGEYQIVRFNLTKNIGETINALRLDPFSNCSDDFKAEFELDYIYVGSPHQAPSTYPDAIFMDFTNDNASAGRYLADDTYGGFHYDLGYWYVNANRSAAPVIDHTEGTMTLNIAATTDDYGSTGHSPYVQTTNSSMRSNAVPLHYVPTAEDVIQLRVKFVDCTKVADANARVRFYFTKDIIDDYSYVDGSNYVTMNFTEADLTSGEWATYTVAAGDTFTSAKIINAIRPSFNNIRSADGKNGKIIIDYIYVGPEKDAPKAAYTVNFVGADGKTLYTQLVAKGETAVYLGSTPTKAADATNHYTFKGWDKALTNITANTTLTAQFTATAHSYTYAKVDATNHKGTCSCGYTVTTAHGWDSGKITTAATCTATGVKTYTCSTCKATKTEPVAALGHDYGYTNNGDGTHTVTCARCDHSFTEPHSFTNGSCICGSTEVSVDETIKIYHTLDLASDISVSFVVPVSALSAYDSYYLECVLPEYEGNELTGTSTVRIEPVVNGNYHYFTLTGITAVRMGDMVDAVLHMTKGTQTYISKTDSYSVATYAYAMLGSSSDSKMLSLCADLLRYGAAAQTYKGYRTDALVDANMTKAQMAYLTDLETVTFGNNNKELAPIENATITWAGKSLDLASKVTMKFVFNAKNYTGDVSELTLRVNYLNLAGEKVALTLTDPELYSGTYYSFDFDGLLVAELRQVVSVAVYNGNTRLSSVLQFSADTYGNNQTGDLGHLCKSLMAYSDSAKLFFAE